MSINTKPFTLKAGKRYFRQDGSVTAPLVATGVGETPYTCGWYHYTTSGRFYTNKRCYLDLIAEYIEPRTVDRTIFGAAQVGAEPVPVVDKFADLKEAYANDATKKEIKK